MAHVSAGVEYALHCLVYLVDAQELEQPVAARDLAALQKIPAEFVAKLFTKLQKAGIVASRDGITIDAADLEAVKNDIKMLRSQVEQA